jgi:RNA polymerase sigma-70 factor, ECF subfamily
MCIIVVIADILRAWPVGEVTMGNMRGVRGRPQGADPYPNIHIAPVLTITTREVERTHVGMRTKKTTDAINRVPTHASVLDFGTLYEKFSRPIHTYVYRLLGSQEDADDLTQEVFTRAYIAWNDLYDRDNLSPWLYRIATNLCVDQLRRRKRISWWPLARTRRGGEAGEGREEDMWHLPPDNGGIPEVGEREHIQRALASMPQDYAVALVLSAAQGVPYQEIGGILGISPNAAATRISRAKRMFMEVYQRFSDEGVEKQER